MSSSGVLNRTSIEGVSKKTIALSQMVSSGFGAGSKSAVLGSISTCQKVANIYLAFDSGWYRIVGTLHSVLLLRRRALWIRAG